MHATRRYAGVRVFGIEMDQEVYLEPLTLDAEIAAYWLDPGRAVRELLAALARHYPLDPSVQPVDESVVRAEAAYRNLLLNACNIIPLTSLPPDRRLATRQLTLRTLYAPLKVSVEREAGDAADTDLLDSIERRRFHSSGALPRGETGEHVLSKSAPVGDHHRRTVTVEPGVRLQTSRRMVILGDPGAGKSTLLRWMATAYLLRLRGDPDWSQLPAVDTLPEEDLLPVLLRCRDLGGEQLSGSLVDMLAHVLRRAELPDDQVEALQSSLQRRLTEGTALLLVDGLDEIADAPTRARVCEQFERVHLAYPAAPIIVTSRIVGYREMGYRIGHGFEHVTLAELDRTDKDDFIRRWCAVTVPPSQQLEVADEIIKDIHGTERIERLTGNPMLLTTMALVKRTVGKLPEHRADLYRAAIGVLLNWRPEVNSPVEYREAVPQLGYMACDMSLRGVQQIGDDDLITLLKSMRVEYGGRLHAIMRHTPEEFVRLMENRTGLLNEAGRVDDVPVYEFRHLTFQEYLTALALVERRFPGRHPHRALADDIARLAARLDTPVATDTSADRSWQEAVRLVVTMCGDDDVDPVLQAILGPGDRDPQVATPRTVLAARCLQDEPHAGPTLVRTLLQRLVQALPAEGLDLDIHDAVRSLAESRWSSALISQLLAELEARGANASPDLVALLGDVISRSAPTKAAEREPWEKARVDDLAAEDRGTVLKAVLVVGHGGFGDDRAAKRLLRLLRHPDDMVAGAAAWALGRLGEEDETCAWRLTDDQADAVRRTVDPAVAPPPRLVQLAQVLPPQRWPEAIEPLTRATRDSSPSVRGAAVRHLGTTRRLSVIPAVAARLQDEVPSVRVAAAHALGTLRFDGAVPLLLSSLSDESPDMRRAAAAALGRIGDSRAVPALITALRDDAGKTGDHYAVALGNLGDERATVPVLDRLKAPAQDPTWQSLIALGRLGAADALSYLVDRLVNDPQKLDFWLGWALREIGDTRFYEQISTSGSTKILPTLGRLGGSLPWDQVQTALRDSDPERREDALLALEQIGGDPAAQAIADAASDEVASVRRVAAKALDGIDDRRLLTPLLALLEDPDVSVRLAAIAALGAFPDHTVFAFLAPLAQEQDARLRIAVARAFNSHFDPRPVKLLVEALSDPVAEVREQAARSLGSQGNRGPIKRLHASLDDPDPDVRSTAAGALGQLGARSSAHRIVGMLSSDHAGERVWAAYSLGELSAAAAAPALIAALTDPFARVREWAASALGYIGGESVIDALLGRLDDTNTDARIAVYSALARLNDPRAGEPVLAGLTDPHPRVREAAADAIGRLGLTANAVDIQPYLEDRHWRVRSAVCWSLGMLDAADAFPSLLTGITDPHPSVQRAAIWALGLLGNSVALDPLEPLASHPIAQVRANALAALARIAPDSTRTLVLAGLRNDPHPSVRRAAAWALRLHPDADYVSTLIERLDDVHQDVRGAAALALGGSGDATAAAKLRQSLDDPSLWVRGRVVNALAQLHDRSAAEPIGQLATHLDPWLSARACWALGKLGNPRPLLALRTRMTTVAGSDRRDVVAVLGHYGDAYARRLIREGLRHSAAVRRRSWLDSVAWTCSDLVDRALLTRDGDGDLPFIDPAVPIDERRVALLARRLHRSVEEVSSRYGVLAREIPLRLS
ncbi:HEAT repeat domain-containing protein [Actinoplanes sp. RD1]|uniref:HEAT repeat domain-containing protein n=1 Tax=Actinoplanes sp. RD1 TaxID=3064538 RepID=UPI002740BE64|nr:HEAT repeat domain-containing protein [Actinoplanes sp. RD1]